MKTQNLFFILVLCFLVPKSIEAQKSKSVDLVHAYFKAVDEGSVDGIKNLLAPGFQANAPFSPVPLEVENWVNVLQAFNTGFSDLKHEVIQIFSDGNRVAVQGRLTGTNTKPFMGKPAGNHKIDVPFHTIFTLDKSKLKSIHAQFDHQTFLNQLEGISLVAKMNGEKNIRQLFVEMDAANVNEFSKYCSPTFKISNPFLPAPMPIQAFQGVIQTQKTAFPDMQHQINEIIANGRVITTKGNFTGTNTGSLMGNAPTGKKVNIPFLVWDEIDSDGKVLSRNVQFDNKAFESQLMAGMVTAEAMRTAVKGSFEALNKRDFDQFSTYLTENTVDYGTPEPTKGRAAVVASIKEFFSAFPDFTIDLEDIAISGNKAYAKSTVKGTHTQSLFGMIPATGKRLHWSDVDAMEFNAEGKISAHWILNGNAPFDQLGYHAFTNPNTNLVMDAYQKFGKGDVAGIVSLCSEMVTWDVADNPQLKMPKIYKGQKEVLQFFGDLMANSEVIKFEPLRFMADGDEVTTINSIEWKNKTTHKSWGATYIHHFKFEQGKVVSFREISGKPWPIMVSASK